MVSDPGVGIQRFCGICGTVCMLQNQDKQAKRNPDGDEGAEPVNLATGLFTVDKTDLVLPGRIPAVIARSFNPFDPIGGIAGFRLRLGLGWYLSVDVILQEDSPTVRRLILPGNSRFLFPKQPDGTFTNAVHPRFAGAVLTAESGGFHRLRFKDGRKAHHGDHGAHGDGGREG